jgi:mRNA-degrading endonuclease RelE of RelBE toxin-antitoxin system
MSSINISPEFLESFMDLPKQIQKKTIDFIERFSNNPNSPGIHYEKINTIGDKQLRSGRIDREYRAIIYEENNENFINYHLLWAEIHDLAYRRAEQKEAINQLIASRITIQSRTAYQDKCLTREHAKALFAGIPHKTLLNMGVPREHIPLLKELKGYNKFEQIKKELETVLPKDVCETLELIALGEHAQKIVDDNRARRKKALDLIYEKVLDPGIACDGIDEDIKESLRNTKDRLEKKKTLGGVVDFYNDALQAKQGKKIAAILKRHNIQRLEDIQDEFAKITLNAIGSRD